MRRNRGLNRKRKILGKRKQKRGCHTPSARDLLGSTKRFLNELHIGDKAKILKVPAHSLFAPLGIREGKTITVKCKHAFSGPYLLCTDGREIAVSRHIAAQIEVQLCSEDS